MGAAGGGHHPDHGPRQLYKKADNYFPAREVRFRMWPTAPTSITARCRTTLILCERQDYILDIHEPVPADEVLEQRDYLREHKRLPFFMIIECVKPA